MKRGSAVGRLPPTERVHPRSGDLDLQPIGEVVSRLHAEDSVAILAVGRVLPSIARAAERISAALKQGGRLFYVGAGTSGRLGALDAAECPPTFGVSPQVVQAIIAGGAKALTAAVEGAEDDPDDGRRQLVRRRIGPRDVVCGISASSTTPFVRGALAEAKRRGAGTVLVCCNPSGKERGVADVVIAPVTGPELIAGSTRLKAGTATKLVLNALSTAAMVSLGKVYRGRMVDLRPTNAKLRARAARMVSELAGVPLRSAQALLRRAGGQPRIALAMHLTGATRAEAEALLRDRGLRDLE